MAKLVDMPKLSPTMEEGQIAAWHKSEGDAIDVDDLLAEVETDKATMEFRSFDRGVLLKILAPAHAIVKLGDPVAIIGSAGEDISDLLANATASAEVAVSPPQPAVKSVPPLRASPATPPPPAQASPGPVGTPGRAKASPYVRKLARERGFDLTTVAGSGPGGRIVARDLEQPKSVRLVVSNAPPPMGDGQLAAPEKLPLSMTRRTIARRLTESKQTVPHFYLTIDVDAGPLAELRNAVNHDLTQAPEPTKLSFNDFVLKACAIALERVPAVNAQFTPEALLFHRRVDISVAVAIDEGLVTPVVRNANKKGLVEIGREVRDLAGRARDRKLRLDEMTGGTFSVSNLGMYGIEQFAAVINPPEGAILAIGAIRSEPVVADGVVVPGKRMKMTLSCDHRVVDGAVGATFLAALRKIIEQPTQILIC